MYHEGLARGFPSSKSDHRPLAPRDTSDEGVDVDSADDDDDSMYDESPLKSKRKR